MLGEYLVRSRPLLAESADSTDALFLTGYGGLRARVRGPSVQEVAQGRWHQSQWLLPLHPTQLRDLHARRRRRPLGDPTPTGHSRLDTTAIYLHVLNVRLCDVHACCHPHGEHVLAASPPQSPAIEDANSFE